MRKSLDQKPIYLVINLLKECYKVKVKVVNNYFINLKNLLKWLLELDIWIKNYKNKVISN